MRRVVDDIDVDDDDEAAERRFQFLETSMETRRRFVTAVGVNCAATVGVVGAGVAAFGVGVAGAAFGVGVAGAATDVAAFVVGAGVADVAAFVVGAGVADVAGVAGVAGVAVSAVSADVAADVDFVADADVGVADVASAAVATLIISLKDRWCSKQTLIRPQPWDVSSEGRCRHHRR